MSRQGHRRACEWHSAISIRQLPIHDLEDRVGRGWAQIAPQPSEFECGALKGHGTQNDSSCCRWPVFRSPLLNPSGWISGWPRKCACEDDPRAELPLLHAVMRPCSRGVAVAMATGMQLPRSKLRNHAGRPSANAGRIVLKAPASKEDCTCATRHLVRNVAHVPLPAALAGQGSRFDRLRKFACSLRKARNILEFRIAPTGD